MATCRLLELPCELLREVYSLLEIRDRVRLNAALPREDGGKMHTAADRDRDSKLVMVHRFFLGRAGNVEVSYPMRVLFQQHPTDPTVCRVLRDMPALSSRSFQDLASMIKDRPDQIVWTDMHQEDTAAMTAVHRFGTPATFRSMMSCDNWLRTKCIDSCAWLSVELVIHRNVELLTYVMRLPEDNLEGFPVVAARRFMSRFATVKIFLEQLSQLRMFVECVGLDPAVLKALHEDALNRLIRPAVAYLDRLLL